jgi:hypothetical protein
MADLKQFGFAAIAPSQGSINREAGTMAGVSLISVGEALGHGAYVDEDSIDTALSALNQMGGGLPAYITHRGALFDDRLTREIGMFTGFRVEGEQLKADFTAFDSFKEDESRKFNRLFEMAEKMPERFGLSIVFSAVMAWATADGDVPGSMDRPETAQFEFPSVRVLEVNSADFVDTPAANQRGLFSKIDTKTLSKMTKAELTEKYEALEAEKVTLAKQVEDMEGNASAFEAQTEEIKQLTASKADLETDLNSTKEQLAEVQALSAKLAEEKEAAEQALASFKQESDNKVSEYKAMIEATESELIQLKSLAKGEDLEALDANQDAVPDYVPSQARRDAEVAEYAQVHNISQFSATLQLSREKPELFN